MRHMNVIQEKVVQHLVSTRSVKLCSHELICLEERFCAICSAFRKVGLEIPKEVNEAANLNSRLIRNGERGVTIIRRRRYLHQRSRRLMGMCEKC